MNFTKKELLRAFYLLLDEQLPNINCELVEKQGNSDCGRCDTCMMNQYIKRVKNGEMPQIAKCRNDI